MNKLGYHKKTILQVVPSLNSGGVERSTVDIAGYLVKNHYKSLVVSSGGRLLNQLEDMGNTNIIMKVNTKNPLVMWHNNLLLRKIIKKYKVDIIHSGSRAPAWSSYFAAKNTQANFITTFHGIYNVHSWYKKIYNSIMTKGKLVIAVSNFVKEHIIQNYNLNEDKIRVVYNGVNLDEFSTTKLVPEILSKTRVKYNVQEDIPIILLPARVTRWKGHKIVIEALNLIKDLDFYCLMIGDLSSRAYYVREMKELIIKHKLQSKIQFFGPEIDTKYLYGISDIVLSASIEPEAFGYTIIEAQAMKKIVIASYLGAVKETIKDEYTGFHVKPGNIQDLAERIKYVLLNLNSKKIDLIRNNARRLVEENFSLEKTLNGTLNVYNELF